MRYDGRTEEALDVEGKVVIPKKKRDRAAASGSPSARRSKRLKDREEQESEPNYAVDEGSYIESCVGI